MKYMGWIKAMKLIRKKRTCNMQRKHCDRKPLILNAGSMSN